MNVSKKYVYLLLISLAAHITASASTFITNEDHRPSSKQAISTLSHADSQALAVGYLYTSTNSAKGNRILKLTRYIDGTLGEEKSFSTKGLGAADPDRDGPAHGDFDSNNAIKIIDNYLLVVNAGDDSISVFRLNRETGDLAFLEKVDSGGKRPVSIAYSKRYYKVDTPSHNNKLISSDRVWVLIANQESNPNLQGTDRNNLKYFPNYEYFRQYLSEADDSDLQRNISEFTLNLKTGALVKSMTTPLMTFDRENGGPTSIVGADNDFLVTTAGIPHLFTHTPLAGQIFQHPSRFYAFILDPVTGKIRAKDYWQKEGVAGLSSPMWLSATNVYYFLSSNHVNELPSYDLITVMNTSLTNTILQETRHISIDETDQAGTFYNRAVSGFFQNRMRAYVSSFDDNSIASFAVDFFGGKVTRLNHVLHAEGYAPKGDSKDLYVTRTHHGDRLQDDTFVYSLGAFRSFSLSGYKATEEGLAYIGQYTYKQTQDSVGQAGKYNFMGLTGFDFDEPQ
ncbi:MAG: hypothetical protein ACPGUD_09845 [Parashewanella sp.]